MDDLHVAIEAARSAGEIISRFFGSPPDPEYKGKFDPVTAVDRAAEEAILDTLRNHRPDDAVLAEESGGETVAGRHWIVDPLDGTVNFIHSIPHVSVSVALYEGDRAMAAVVHDPLRDEVFTAADGITASRDTDWFRVYALETGTMEMYVEAQWPTSIFKLAPLDCPTVAVELSATTNCETGATLSFPVTAGEEIWLWVGPSDFNPPPGVLNRNYFYSMTVTNNMFGVVPVEESSLGAVKAMYR